MSSIGHRIGVERAQCLGERLRVQVLRHRYHDEAELGLDRELVLAELEDAGERGDGAPDVGAALELEVRARRHRRAA